MTKGRKRDQSAERYPCGKKKQEKKGFDLTRRELDIIKRERLNPLWGSHVGRMRVNEEINENQFNAATRIIELRRSFCRVYNIPAGTPKAQDINAVHGLDHIPDGLDRADQAAVLSYNRAILALGLRSDEFKAIRDVLFFDQPPCPHSVRLSLAAGLKMLADHFGQPKSTRKSNAA